MPATSQRADPIFPSCTPQVARNLSTVWLANFAGAALLAAAFYAAGQPAGAAPIALATAKCSLPWGVAFLRGVLCNILVCVAVIQVRRGKQW